MKMADKFQANATASDQICFTGESDCPTFNGHFLKPDICTNCMKDLAKHTRGSVKSEESVLKVRILNVR